MSIANDPFTLVATRTFPDGSYERSVPRGGAPGTVAAMARVERFRRKNEPEAPLKV